MKFFGELAALADAKAFATATLPTLRAHLKAINAIAADMGIKTK